MNELPKDLVMLLSVVNTKLRDEFSNLDELCGAYGILADDLKGKLSAIDYAYDEGTNQFV